METRSEKEVSEWLYQQRWIRSFVRNIRNMTSTSKKEAKRILEGQYKVNTIAAGFDWSASPQGHKYWKERDNELRQWYYGKEIEN